MFIEIEGSLVVPDHIWSLTKVKPDEYNESIFSFKVMVNAGYIEINRATLEEAEQERHRIKNLIDNKGVQQLNG